jgi:hypothetical protein
MLIFPLAREKIAFPLTGQKMMIFPLENKKKCKFTKKGYFFLYGGKIRKNFPLWTKIETFFLLLDENWDRPPYSKILKPSLISAQRKNMYLF